MFASYGLFPTCLSSAVILLVLVLVLVEVVVLEASRAANSSARVEAARAASWAAFT